MVAELGLPDLPHAVEEPDLLGDRRRQRHQALVDRDELLPLPRVGHARDQALGREQPGEPLPPVLPAAAADD